MVHYEEHRNVSQPWAWAIIVIFSVNILGWGMVLMCIVRDVPRQWDFGQLADAPAQSIYSTRKYAATQPYQRQIAPLPEAATQNTRVLLAQPASPPPRPATMPARGEGGRP